MTFVDLLRRHASDRADDLAFLFVEDGESVEHRMSYSELARSAADVARRLVERGEPGDRVLIICAPGLEYVISLFGCFLASRVAVPLYPPETNRLIRSLERIAAIVEDCTPRTMLVDPLIGSFAETICGLSPVLATLEWITVDRSAPSATSKDVQVQVDAASAAILQYTSGSTGTPKGVILTHANLIANAQNVAPYFTEGPCVGWLPPYHDFGLMGMLLQPFFTAVPSISMSPLHFLQRPARWLRLVSKYRATVTGGPNFAFDLCVRKAEPDSLDLSALRAVYNGAEPIRPSTLRSFSEKFAPFGFDEKTLLPSYGLAEATLFVSARALGTGFSCERVAVDALEHGLARAPGSGEQERELVSCGRAAAGNEVRVVDPETLLPAPARQVGEIWVKGANVCAGYYARGATEETFRMEPDGVVLRTGDMGFLREDGELFVTGRRKDLIIIRGRNLYPQDIEHAVEGAHGHVRKGCVAAFGLERERDGSGGEETVVVVLEAGTRGGPRAPSAEIRAAVLSAVAVECGVQLSAVVILEPGSLPKTSSGKLRRRATRSGYIDGSLKEVESDK